MPAKSVTMSENGRCAYQGNLNHWIYPALGNLKMPDITPANISALLLSMQSQGKAHATCVKVYTILHSLFKMAYMADVILANPMDKVEHPKPRKGEIKDKDVESCTTEEVQASAGASVAGSSGKISTSRLTQSLFEGTSATRLKRAFTWTRPRVAR